jgi:Flp pilus assembly protein CpaB
VRLVQGPARRIDLPSLRAGHPPVSRHRRRAILHLGLAVALAVAGLAILGRRSATSPRVQMATQVVVVQSVAAGGRLTAAALAVSRLPAPYVSSGAVADPRAVLGRRLAVALPAGAPLMEAELASTDGPVVGRDVAVRVDDAAGLPAGDLAGAHADVVLLLPGRGTAPSVVLSNALVVAAGRSDGTAVATLRLPPAAVGPVIAAEARGSLRLVVRVGQGVG